MKKFLLSLVTVIMTVGAANAGQQVSKEDARIYINPGHGSWTSNDRNMATINHSTGDTTGFYESNTNLWKGLKLRQVLIDWGVPAEHICMSRVKNGPYPHTTEEAEKYNRNLTEIAQEANSFNSDYFISIHSDAGDNHTLLIHKGYSTPAEDNYMIHGSKYGSKELMQICSDMCYTSWPYITSNGIDVMASAVMQSGSPYIRGDFTFYYGWTSPSQNTGKSGYLGVLRTNTCPGFLSEGYSHQYLPATHRALNPDYCGQEGMRYARGIAEWFGWEKDTKGYIMGSVKDLHTRLEHYLYNYTAGSIDQWKPINKAVVTLYKGGVEIAKYTCDNEWNGVFVFEGLEPGDDYMIDATAEGYKSVFELNEEFGRENETLSVTANETTYPVIYLEASDYVANPTYNYAHPDQEKWLALASKYDMRQDFTNKPLAELDGKTIRRELAHGDSIYALALEADNTPHIYCYNAKTQELYFELSTEGIGTSGDENEVLKISDIAFTSDSILVACNSVKTSFDPTGVFRVYTWEKDENTRSPKGNPSEWFTSATNYTSGNFSAAVTGNTLAVSGYKEKCLVITTAETTDASGEIRLPVFTMNRKGLASTMRNQDKTHFTKALLGDDYKLCASPYADDAFVIDGSATTPFDFTLAGDVQAPVYGTQMSADVMPAATNGATFFKYAKHIMVAVPKTNADGKNVGVAMYDIANGLDKAVLIETTNTDIDASDASHLMVSTHVEGADITIYLNKDNTVSRFTTQDVEQTYYKSVYAYDLDVAANDGNYTFSFKANEDCFEGGKLIFYDATSGEKVGEVALDNVVAGANEKVIAATELPGTAGQVLNWSVEVASYNVTIMQPVLEKGGDYAKNRMYATVDNSPESPYFGKIYVSDFVGANKATNGVYVYNQDYALENTTAYTGGLTFGTNGCLATDVYGNIYVTDANVAKSGLWLASANDFPTSFAQFYAGELSSTGVFTQNETEIGGVSSSLSFYGDKLYVYAKNSANKYVVNVYNVVNEDGTMATSCAEAPSKVLAMPAGSIADASIVAVEQGVWVCQNISSSSNDGVSPSLIFVDNDGNVTFNQGLDQNHYLLSGAAGSGIAVSRDGKTLVVNDENGILQFFDVTWDGTTPVLTNKYSYEHGIGVGAKRIQDGLYVEQIAFDYAGNLVASGHYLGVFTVPTENNVCETPARSWKTVTCGSASVAVETVKTDENAPVEYYNLQGMRVVNPEKGVFIKKQGSKATKVVL